MSEYADFYEIKLPRLRRSGINCDPVLVCIDSPEHYRKNVERFARYFLREMQYDFIQFEATENIFQPNYKPYNAYLFHNKQQFLGACCFRFDESATQCWCLDWVWLHPFARRKGYLSKSWPCFYEKYGSFNISRPLSDGMEKFLVKVRR